jgi:AraC-like DNA-binding protein
MFLDLIGKRSSIADEEQPESAIVSRLRHVLNRENLSQQEIARAFGMSVATLQRRLAESGHSFREVSRQIRVEKLRSLLATDSSLDDIAVQVGFSERRSLWRACQDWLGVSPAGYRRMLRMNQAVREPRAGRVWSAMPGQLQAQQV